MPGALRLKLNAGDAALFNAVGLHRGRYHTDKLRRTLMLTYSPNSRPHYDYFSNQPWFLDPGYLHGLDAKTKAFFELFVNEYEAKWRKDLQPAAVVSFGCWQKCEGMSLAFCCDFDFDCLLEHHH